MTVLHVKQSRVFKHAARWVLFNELQFTAALLKIIIQYKLHMKNLAASSVNNGELLYT